jgi:hypothetical protein
MANLPTRQKFRPYFSESELGVVIETLKTHQAPRSKLTGILKYLETFVIKMERGVISPSLDLKGTPREQLIKSLELDTPSSPSLISVVKDKEQEGSILYSKWREGATLSPKQLERVHIYRYENDLMTSQEEADYEKELMK